MGTNKLLHRGEFDKTCKLPYNLQQLSELILHTGNAVMLTPPNGPCKVKSGPQTKIFGSNTRNSLVWERGCVPDGGRRAHIPAVVCIHKAAELWEKMSMNGLDELFEQILHSERNFKARVNKLRECKPSFY